MFRDEEFGEWEEFFIGDMDEFFFLGIEDRGLGFGIFFKE